MKNSIPSDIWEKKRALIAKLYKDEEWPLKQVIKQIRSEDFNPSETQLRSRLKKWRVTKPSRQTRKKSHDSHQDAAGDESGEDASPKRTSASPSKPAHEDLPVTEPDWFMVNGAYAPPSLEEHNSWVPLSPPHHHSHLSNSPSVVPFPNGLDSSVSSPVDALINPASTMSPYTSPPYSVAPELQSSASTSTTATPVPWHVLQWYSMPLEAVTQSHQGPFYSAPLSPPAHDQTVPSMPPPGQMYSPQSPQFAGMPPGMEFMDEKPWRRTMSVNYPEAAGGLAVDRQRKHVERKTSLPSKVVASQPHYYGQHPMMCAPLYSYGQELKPSVGF